MVEGNRPRLVVIGSGWVGLYVAQYIDTKKYSVLIISPKQTSAYTPLLASAACGLFAFRYAEESLRAKGRDCSFIKATVLGVDFDAKKVQCQAAFAVDKSSLAEKLFDIVYDKLIIAPGCE